MISDELTERRRLWLLWLDLPWDSVREGFIFEMRRVGMSQEDLAYQLRLEGFTVTTRTIGNWLSGRTREGNAPTMSAMQALVRVFARVALGSWTK